MEKELLSEQIRISPTLKNRLEQIARHRDTYNDVITKALNYYEACNCPKQVDEIHKISIRYSMQYQHVYFIWLEKNRSVDLTIEEIMKIKRDGLIIKDIANHPANLDFCKCLKLNGNGRQAGSLGRGNGD